jgi:hypothetical protein
MRGTTPPLPQYAFMEWYSVKAQGQLYLLCYKVRKLGSYIRTVLGRSNTGIVASNPVRGMDVCPRFSVLCCPVCR